MQMQKQYERQADFTLGETLSNYYNVKYYSAEAVEIQRYSSILEVSYKPWHVMPFLTDLPTLLTSQNYKKQTIENQRTLADLNTGQRAVFSIGMTANMIYGAFRV